MKNVNQNIPKSWKKLEFDQIAYLNNKKYIPNKNEHLKCLELEHIEKETGRIIGYIDSTEQSSTKNVFKSGDILFGKLRPYLKKFTRPFFDGVCSTEIWVLSATHNCINEYLYQLIQLNSFLSACNVSLGTHMPRADWGFVSHFPFHIPPLPEQEKIAEILGTWDLAIEKLTALIAAKRLQKKGLVYSYVKNAKDTDLYTISDLFSLTRGRIISKNEIEQNLGTYPVFSSQTSNDGILGYIDSFDYDGEFITWTTDGANAGRVFFRKGRFNCTNVCGLASLKNGISLNLYYTMTYLNLVTKYYVSYVGNPKLMNNAFASISLHLPNIDYQNKVADILSKADEEIDLLTRKLDLLQSQKKGLMQQLLTGKIRVKVA